LTQISRRIARRVGRSPETVRYTMVNGRIYDAHTMNEVGNHPEDRLPFYWEKPGASDAFIWHGDATGYQHPGCGCFAH